MILAILLFNENEFVHFLQFSNICGDVQNAYTLFYLGSQGPGCNNEGQCSCKQGVYEDKCDRCRDDSPFTASGCEPLR